MTTIYPNVNYDDACLLEVGDHAAVVHPSYMFYGRARLVTAADWQQLDQAGALRAAAPWPEATFTRICQGTTMSTRIPMKLRVHYQTHKER